MIRFKVLMIAFPVYIYFHGPYFLPILMGFVLPICGPFLFFHYYLPFRTLVIPYAQPWRGRIPPYHDLYNRPVLSYSFICLHLTRRPLLIAMSSPQIGGIERPFRVVLIMGMPLLIKALYFV